MLDRNHLLYQINETKQPYVLECGVKQKSVLMSVKAKIEEIFSKKLPVVLQSCSHHSENARRNGSGTRIYLNITEFISKHKDYKKKINKKEKEN